MDGDTCGGLSPIAGIDKAFLRHWLRWMEQTGPTDIGPITALKSVNDLETHRRITTSKPASNRRNRFDALRFARRDRAFGDPG